MKLRVVIPLHLAFSCRAPKSAGKSDRLCISRYIAVRWYSRRRLWPIERYICDSYLRRPGTILDVACAGGRTAIPLSSYTKSWVIGFDISFNQVREASQAARETGLNCFFFQCDMSAIGVGNQSMDYVFITYTSLGALTTIEGRHSALKEIARVLKPDGIAFISRFGIASGLANWASNG